MPLHVSTCVQAREAPPISTGEVLLSPGKISSALHTPNSLRAYVLLIWRGLDSGVPRSPRDRLGTRLNPTSTPKASGSQPAGELVCTM